MALPQGHEIFLKTYCKRLKFKQNWRHHHRKHFQSDLTGEMSSKKPVKNT